MSTGKKMYETSRNTHATALTTLIQLAAVESVSKCAGYNHSVLGHGRQHVRFAVSFWQMRPSGTRGSVRVSPCFPPRLVAVGGEGIPLTALV